MLSAIYLSEHDHVVIAEVIEAFVAAHVAKDRSNLPRGPLQRRKRGQGCRPPVDPSEVVKSAAR